MEIPSATESGEEARTIGQDAEKVRDNVPVAKVTNLPVWTHFTHDDLHRAVEITLHGPDLTAVRIVTEEHETVPGNTDIIPMNRALSTEFRNVASQIIWIFFVEQIMQLGPAILASHRAKSGSPHVVRVTIHWIFFPGPPSIKPVIKFLESAHDNGFSCAIQAGRSGCCRVIGIRYLP